MTIPRSDQTVHLMNKWNVLCVIVRLHRKEKRLVNELRLYALDDLRQLYQSTETGVIRLRDGNLWPFELAAVIRWRLGWAAAGWWLLAFLSLTAAVAAVIAAWEGRATLN